MARRARRQVRGVPPRRPAPRIPRSSRCQRSVLRFPRSTQTLSSQTAGLPKSARPRSRWTRRPARDVRVAVSRHPAAPPASRRMMPIEMGSRTARMKMISVPRLPSMNGGRYIRGGIDVKPGSAPGFPLCPRRSVVRCASRFSRCCERELTWSCNAPIKAVWPASAGGAVAIGVCMIDSGCGCDVRNDMFSILYFSVWCIRRTNRLSLRDVDRFDRSSTEFAEWSTVAGT